MNVSRKRVLKGVLVGVGMRLMPCPRMRTLVTRIINLMGLGHA